MAVCAEDGIVGSPGSLANEPPGWDRLKAWTTWPEVPVSGNMDRRIAIKKHLDLGHTFFYSGYEAYRCSIKPARRAPPPASCPSSSVPHGGRLHATRHHHRHSRGPRPLLHRCLRPAVPPLEWPTGVLAHHYLIPAPFMAGAGHHTPPRLAPAPSFHAAHAGWLSTIARDNPLLLGTPPARADAQVA